MNARIGLLILVVGAGTLLAQTTPTAAQAPATPANAQQKAAPAKPAKTASAPSAKSTTSTTTTTTTKTTTKTPSKTAKAAKPAATKKTAEKPAEKPATTDAAAAEKPKTASVSAQKRDPFISPIQTHVNGPINCGTGKRCLVVDQTVLQGVVNAPNGMIAVVSNSANKAYFLRENDPVYNGFVSRITPDSVVFREQVTDRLGRTSTREVVKKVVVPAV